MIRAKTAAKQGTDASQGFTLIELLVVVAIIATLIGILLPSLSNARKMGQAVKCGANLHDIAGAMNNYLADWNGVYPPAYMYPSDSEGNYDFEAQPPDHPYGYIHWSWYLYAQGQVDTDAFQCPSIPNGGAPRTNPGSEQFETGQVDQNGQSSPNALQDAQAPRLAYCGNAAVFPRNKFTPELSGGVRINKFVAESQLIDPAGTILMTEYTDNWMNVAVNEGGGLLSKSHRSVNPFQHLSSGANEYGAPLNTPGFTYGTAPRYGLLPKEQVRDRVGLIDDPGTAETNSVGRHHPGGDSYSGGTANFMFADGHVERKGILQTLVDRDWGLRYYTITGHNKVGPPFE